MEDTKKKKIRQSFTAWLLSVCFAASLAALVLYLLDLHYDDSFIYFLLLVLRYTAFLVAVIAFYKLLLNFYRLIIKRRRFHPLKILIYLFLLVYGIALYLIEAFIVVISGGNT